MAYTKTSWESGVTALSADNMNHIENGIKDLENNLGAISSLVEGSYTTSRWAEGTRTAVWTAPADGVYLIFMYITLTADFLAAEYRNSYRQFQFQGTATIPVKALFYDTGVTGSGNENPNVGRTIITPVIATAGQQIWPYVHSDTSGIVFNYTIYSIRLK